MPSHPGLHEAFSESKDDNGVLLALEYGVWLPPLPGILGAGLGLLRALWGQEPDPDSPTSAPPAGGSLCKARVIHLFPVRQAGPRCSQMMTGDGRGEVTLPRPPFVNVGAWTGPQGSALHPWPGWGGGKGG